MSMLPVIIVNSFLILILLPSVEHVEESMFVVGYFEAGGDLVFCKGGNDNAPIKILTKGSEPIRRVHPCFVRSWPCLGLILS